MPIYEYDCPKCGRFEVIQKFSDKPLKCNPDCTDSSCPKKAVRVMSESAFHLKGGGWYKTDYGSSGANGSKKSGDASPQTSAEGSSDASGKGESKKGEKKALATAKGGCGSGCGCH